MGMGAELTPARLAEPAPQATRLLANERLAQVSAAYERITADDATALHDLRVALRRLRSWLRAYRPEVTDTLSKKTRRRLTRLARATNAARDAEVGLEWLSAQTDLKPRERAGARYVAGRLERDRDEGWRDARKALEKGLPKLLKSLKSQLDTYWLQYSVQEPATVTRMAAATHDVLVDHSERLAATIANIESPADFRGIHRSRMQAKRLRYLLETLNGDAAAQALVQRLRTLQDTLGQSRDAHRMAKRLVREIGSCAARDARRAALEAMSIADDRDDAPPFARIRPGLIALAKRAHESDRKAYDSFRRAWRKRELQRTLAGVEAVAEALAAGRGELPPR